MQYWLRTKYVQKAVAAAYKNSIAEALEDAFWLVFNQQKNDVTQLCELVKLTLHEKIGENGINLDVDSLR